MLSARFSRYEYYDAGMDDEESLDGSIRLRGDDDDDDEDDF